MLDGGWGVRWEVRRTPIALTVRAATLRFGTTLEYRAWGCKELGKPWPFKGSACPQVGSCSGAMEAWIEATPDVTADWRVDLHAAPGANPLSRCKVTFLDYDVTDRITGALTQKLREVVGAIEQRLSETVRRSSEDAWRGLQQPIPLDRGFWLAVRPTAAQVGPFEARDGLLLNQVALTAHVRLASRQPPAEPSPLPRVGSASSPPHFRVAIEGELPYADASRLLREELQGNAYEVGGEIITVRDVDVRGAGGRALVRVAFSGAGGDAAVVLAGTPRYDPESQVLSVPDLELAAEAAEGSTAPGAPEPGAWATRHWLRDELRERASWRLAEVTEGAASLVASSSTLELGPRARLETRVAQLAVRSVDTSGAGFRVRAHLDGQALVTVVP
jgi:hypothetical protein